MGLAMKLCRNEADANDLVQDTLERGMGRFDQLRPATNARAWLVTIMHNLFIDRCRAERRRPNRVSAEEVAVLPVLESAEPPAWTQISPEMVRTAVARLEKGFRLAYELHVYEHLTYKEISQRLQISPATVGTRIYRARRKLKQLLEATS